MIYVDSFLKQKYRNHYLNHRRCHKLTNSKQLPGLLAAVYFTKTFNTISKKLILDSLRPCGFGPDFIHWVSTLIMETENCTTHSLAGPLRPSRLNGELDKDAPFFSTDLCIGSRTICSQNPKQQCTRN